MKRLDMFGLVVYICTAAGTEFSIENLTRCNVKLSHVILHDNTLGPEVVCWHQMQSVMSLRCIYFQLTPPVSVLRTFHL